MAGPLFHVSQRPTPPQPLPAPRESAPVSFGDSMLMFLGRITLVGICVALAVGFVLWKEDMRKRRAEQAAEHNRHFVEVMNNLSRPSFSEQMRADQEKWGGNMPTLPPWPPASPSTSPFDRGDKSSFDKSAE